MWSKIPLKGSKEYKALVSLTGILIGLVWVARDEMENPKWTGIPKASELSVDDLSEWNKQFGPKDQSKWAIPVEENERILKFLGSTSQPEEPVKKKETW
jgi:hypothetical protein